MCLAEFAATFVPIYQSNDPDGNDILLPTEVDSKPSQISLTNGYGKMNRRKKQAAVIRFRSYNKDTDSNNWFRAKLMLYFPWFNETTDLLGGYSTMRSITTMSDALSLPMSQSSLRLMLRA